MGKFFLLQAFYCITGIAFFVRDLYAKTPMAKAMMNAFIWPYAQWDFIRVRGHELIDPLLRMF